MNKEQFNKNLYRQVRIQPAMQLYESNGLLRGSIDDAWIVAAITDKTFTLRNRATDHCIELGFDSYINFVEDPGGKTRHQTDGVLVLKAQLYMHEGLLNFAATIAPGKELRDFTPPHTRKVLVDAIKGRVEADELQRLRDDFDSRGFADVLKAVDQIGEVLKSVVQELKSTGLSVRVDVHKYNGGYLVWAYGWWVTISWQARGVLRESYLSIVKWRGRPNVAGLSHSIDRAEQVSQSKYHYGVARPNEIGWTVPRQPDAALTTRDILERLLSDLANKPNRDPAPIWNLRE